MKIGVISLGCDKNRIDTENMLAYLNEEGYELTPNVEEADIIVVNTCAFIKSAKQEAIETILEMAEYKKSGNCKFLIVSGCLSQRYMDDLFDELIEVDMFIGTSNYHQLPQLIKEMVENHKRLCVKNDKNDRTFTQKRILSTPSHYAYLKIAEGCNNHCTYCAIPSIRGKYTSRPIEAIVEEAKELIKNYAINELILVAQDVSNYGIDLYGKISLIDLLKELNKLDISWIRLLYLYPENITDELLKFISENPKMCKYLDIPLQHYSDKCLKMMNRRIKQSEINDLFDKIESYGDFTIRSTFIVGFPQENDEDFDELFNFIKQGRIDRCGFFTYSKEEGTPAALIKGHIKESVKKQRQEKLYALQQKVMQIRMKKKIGQVVEVIYEGIDYDKQLFYGRSKSDAPEIDTKVYFTSKDLVEIGQIYKVKIDKVKDLDSYGKVVEE